MDFEKYESGPSGKWVDKQKLKDENITTARIISEVQLYPSKFKNKDGSVQKQAVGSIQFEGLEEPFNMSLNVATMNGLIDAFGKSSNNWIDKELKVDILEGDKGYSVYLIPEGFKRVRVDKKISIVRDMEGVQQAPEEDISIVNLDEDEDGKSLKKVPF